ncbi:MAG: two-component system response regulator [Acidobacteria bacterium]|nr:MAG: two-component system response regulator [Acidobacteriota bacterium]PYY23939.1 MAG: two-component system response regulator [Acidobacteriota bacterium]
MHTADLCLHAMKLRIIVADDNQKMLDQIVLLLRAHFDVIATATDGTAALECIQRYKPDVAVLDVVMPRMNGIELTRELSRNGHSTHVVICSVENDRETIDTARAAGALGYVFKPRMVRDLITAVKSVAAGHPFTSAE